MSKIFPKSANSLPLQIIIYLVVLTGIATAGVTYYMTPKYTRVGYAPVQPVPFSHALHAGQLGLAHTIAGYTGDLGYEIWMRPEYQRYLFDALMEAGIDMVYDCRRGECGLCAVNIVDASTPIDHRDVFFSPEERHEGQKMCACVSRAVGGTAVSVAHLPPGRRRAPGQAGGFFTTLQRRAVAGGTAADPRAVARLEPRTGHRPGLADAAGSTGGMATPRPQLATNATASRRPRHTTGAVHRKAATITGFQGNRFPIPIQDFRT